MQMNWTVAPHAPVEFLTALPGLHPLTAQTLFARGFVDPAQALAFLKAEVPRVDPSSLQGMGVAVERILRGIASNERMAVYGDYKGIPKTTVRKALASGKDVIMRIDVQGAAKIRKIVPNVITIFLATENEDELVRRLTERKTESSDGLAIRIATTREEMKRLKEFDYVVINKEDCLDEAVNQIFSIITAEHCRVNRSPIQL